MFTKYLPPTYQEYTWKSQSSWDLCRITLDNPTINQSHQTLTNNCAKSHINQHHSTISNKTNKHGHHKEVECIEGKAKLASTKKRAKSNSTAARTRETPLPLCLVLARVDRRGAGLDMINESRRDLVQTTSFDFVMGGGDRVTWRWIVPYNTWGMEGGWW